MWTVDGFSVVDAEMGTSHVSTWWQQETIADTGSGGNGWVDIVTGHGYGHSKNFLEAFARF